MIRVFTGLSHSDKKKLFTLLAVHTYVFNPNQNILETLKNDDIIGIILEGFASINHVNYNGDKTFVDELSEEHIFGTVISQINSSDYEMIAKEKTTIMIIDYKNLINPNYINYKYYNVFIQNLFTIINEKMKQKNERINILTKKTIRNKLLEYFQIEQSKNHSKNIYLPSSFTSLADYLAIDRSAMTRELKYLKDEGFIEIKGKRITLLY